MTQRSKSKQHASPSNRAKLLTAVLASSLVVVDRAKWIAEWFSSASRPSDCRLEDMLDLLMQSATEVVVHFGSLSWDYAGLASPQGVKYGSRWYSSAHEAVYEMTRQILFHCTDAVVGVTESDDQSGTLVMREWRILEDYEREGVLEAVRALNFDRLKVALECEYGIALRRLNLEATEGPSPGATGLILTRAGRRKQLNIEDGEITVAEAVALAEKLRDDNRAVSKSTIYRWFNEDGYEKQKKAMKLRQVEGGIPVADRKALLRLIQKGR